MIARGIQNGGVSCVLGGFFFSQLAKFFKKELRSYCAQAWLSFITVILEYAQFRALPLRSSRARTRESQQDLSWKGPLKMI